MCFKQERAISILNGKPLKLLDLFIYFSSDISSTESDVKCILKAWTAIDKLSIIWKSDLSDKTKGFLPSCDCVSPAVRMHHLSTNKMDEEKAWWEVHKNAICCFGQTLEATSYKKSFCTATYLPSHTPSKKNKTYWRSKDKLISDIQ